MARNIKNYSNVRNTKSRLQKTWTTVFVKNKVFMSTLLTL